MPLMCETNTPAIERRVRRAARVRLAGGRRRRYQTDFEHGQWWITDLDTGAQWAVVDCVGPDGEYLDFEQVTRGDDDD